jgi:general stress protein CsbA
LRDRSGIAATEFAVIVPIMLVMFFGKVEFSSGVAVDREVTLVARTLSDLTSQSSTAVDDNYLQNVFTAGIAILSPYSATPAQATLSEICRLQQDREDSVEQGCDHFEQRHAGNAGDVEPQRGRYHYVAGSAFGEANLSDPQRGELSLHIHDRLRDGEVRHDVEQCRLASGRLRDL